MAGQRVWSIFLELNGTRTAGMGPNPIAHGEIEAYARTRRKPVRPFEVTILRALDAAYLDAAREPAGEQEPLGPPMTPDLFRAVFKGQRPAVSARPMTTELFDALFPGN